MNRKQRRAALKQSPQAPRHTAGDFVEQLFAAAVQYERQRKLDDAARAYQRLLALKPDHAQATNNLGCVFQAQGKLREASECFAHSLALMPQLADQFSGPCAAMIGVLPPLGEAMRRASEVWPKRLPADQLLGSTGIAAIATDPLLLSILQSTPVRDVALEHLLTSLRLQLLDTALSDKAPDDSVLKFCCALAKQCFINEYVFATTPGEEERSEQLATTFGEALRANTSVRPDIPAALAMYRTLYSLPFASSLLARKWPDAVDNVITQQLREPQQERELRDSIPRLTPIEDVVSQSVRQQYEENPYPRWVYAATAQETVTIDEHLRRQFPGVPFQSLGKNELDILVAGCGTGRHPIEVAHTYKNSQVLAVDLSLSSLSYAKRKTPPDIASRIEYAQADILKLATIGRTFDVIDASGVLHHMADPLAAWHTLLALLRPHSIMHLGLYSEIARRDVVAARAFIAERGYRPTASEIRRCRQDLLDSPLSRIAKAGDFFSTSECRDLMFHVQEKRLTIPQIKAFLAENGLNFIGFEFGPHILQRYRAHFAQIGKPTTDLDAWNNLEQLHPETFAGMYQFWVQKRAW